jgi:hypothetical protein
MPAYSLGICRTGLEPMSHDDYERTDVRPPSQKTRHQAIPGIPRISFFSRRFDLRAEWVYHLKQQV